MNTLIWVLSLIAILNSAVSIALCVTIQKEIAND